MIRAGTLEGVLFAAFVVAADAFSLGIAPILGVAALASLLAFVLLEDYLGSRRYRAIGFE
jgi:hypothetical protein